jgi:proline racemase
VRAECSGGKVRQVTLRNVPSFATHLDAPIEVPGFGTLNVDVAYGGMFYVQADAERLGVVLEASHGERIVDVALQVLAAAREQLPTAHPENPAINLIESTLLYGPPKSSQNSARNAVVLSHGAIDRCPCGTGTSARLATLRRKGQIEVGQPFRHEGVLDSVFTGRVVEDTHAGDLPAVISEISGRAWISGFHQFVLEDDDPFPEGFTIGDIWPASFSTPLSGSTR